MIQGVTVRTVEDRAATYAETGNSADLIDRRHFNPGQQIDYRMEPYKPALIEHVVLNVVQGQENTERGLAARMGNVVGDRTGGRHLHAMGWRAAEEAGLNEKVAGESLESVLTGEPPQKWQEPGRGQVGGALGIAHLALNGTYESLKRLVRGTLGVLTRWPPLQVWHVLLVYLMTSGGGRGWRSAWRRKKWTRRPWWMGCGLDSETVF